jgi:DHA3 family macrolide efflux protein-like MFS transporter
MLAHPAMALKPIMITEFFDRGAPALAALESAFGIGMVLGGLLLGVWGGFRRRVITAMLALLAQGVGFLLVGLTPATAFGMAVTAFLIIGVMNPIVNGSLMAVLQATVPPDMQGRVFTLVMSGASAATPIGLAVGGPVADTLGVQTWFILSGIAMALMAASGFFVPSVVHIEDEARPKAPSGGFAAAPVEAPQPVAVKTDLAS